MNEEERDLLKTLEFVPDNTWEHIRIINQETCKECSAKICLTICPSWVFRSNATGGTCIEILYKQCIECGACRLACSAANIDFSYPNGGFGVLYREG